MAIYSDTGDLSKIGDIVKSYNVQRILVVSRRKCFELSGAKGILNKLLKGYNVICFSDFELNPKLVDAERGVSLAIENTVEAIICIGGGSAIDMGKLIKALYLNSDDAVNVAKGFTKVSDPNIPLVAIPTTAGSGSESTHFAVVYVEGEKYSLADSCLLPNDIILDGSLTLSATRYQKACNVLDAIAQSIESAWAVCSTVESRVIAFAALDVCVKNFVEYVNTTDNSLVAQSMIKASNLAGQAINITKTTAAHAWSYGLTRRYNIPHGHAVWVTLPKIFEIHAGPHAELIDDPYGSRDHSIVMKTLMDVLNISAKEDIEIFFKDMMASIGIEADIIINFNISIDERIVLSRSINHDRMANNPVIFSQQQVDKIFQLT